MLGHHGGRVTCIVGIETPDGVLIGGDSAGVAGYDLSIRADTKVFRRDDYVMGFTSSFRMGQLLRYAGHLPRLDTWDVDAFMATRFVDAVRELLKAGGYVKTEGGVESGGCFLVGVGHRLYLIGTDFQIGRAVDGYNAVGCGADIALGSLYATRNGNLHRSRAESALEAAAHFSAGVAGPFHLVDNHAQAAA